jgi:hypothetical protein
MNFNLILKKGKPSINKTGCVTLMSKEIAAYESLLGLETTLNNSNNKIY